MNLVQLQQKLLAAARGNPPSERVPLAFEQRILARLRHTPAADVWELWARALWRAAAPCVGCMLLLGVWSFYDSASHRPQTDLSQEFDNTVLAAADQDLPAADSSW